jgi:lipoate-protein ligase A
MLAPERALSAPVRWRLLISEPAGGAMNMAIDEAIAEATVQGHAPPTLRFYDWQPPCLSLGRNQPLADVDVRRCTARGFDVVRRATGGRAILHVDETTYSVAGPASEPTLRGGVLDVYHRLSEGLLQGLRNLGIEALSTSPETPGGSAPSAACFDVPAAHELTAGGRKLMGSAQCRRAGYVLQHGSLPLRGDVARIVDGLRFNHERDREALRATLRRRACTAAESLGKDVSFAVAASALAQGFAAALDLILVPSELTAWEQARAEQLRTEKYASREWTEHR